MLSFTNTRVLLSTEATDMRKSFDALSALVREVIQEDPLSGYLFVFFNRSKTSCKILHWEKSGFWIYYKRLERGRFKLPLKISGCTSLELDAKELSLILEGIDLNGAKHRAVFSRECLE